MNRNNLSTLSAAHATKRITKTLLILVSAIGVSANARADSVTTLDGSACASLKKNTSTALPMPYSYTTTNDVRVQCPIPLKDIPAAGGYVTVNVHGWDNSTTGQFSCSVSAYGRNPTTGAIINGFNSSNVTSSVAGTGWVNLTVGPVAVFPANWATGVTNTPSSAYLQCYLGTGSTSQQINELKITTTW